MKRILYYNAKFHFGCTQGESVTLSSKFQFKPSRILSNAPDDGGAFYLIYEHKNGTTERHDLSVAKLHGIPIDWATLEQGEPLSFRIEHVNYVPRGYVCGNVFELTVSIDGEEHFGGTKRGS